ncbi:MAG: hypothetical protein KC434_16565, partial [Anaerolineales bacterium]|nr:hypothetical protein [Anaerolineales bacterium]
VWLPVSALLSSTALAIHLHRRYPRTKPADAKPKMRVPKGTAVGIGIIMVALFSIPLAPLLSGIPTGLPEHKLMEDLPDRADGAYLALSDGAEAGVLKLFPWSFPVDEFPVESPVINPAQLQNVTISQKGLDQPQRYFLYRLVDEDLIEPVALQAQETEFQRQMELSPTEPLAAGDYMLDIPTGGMFAGREYYYFRVDPTVAALPPLVASPEATVVAEPVVAASSSSGWLNLLPLSSALISGAMALLMLNRMRQKIRPQEAAWTLAFAMFAIAAGSQVWGDVAGWSPFLAKLYYVFGASLVVGWLGLGTWLVVVRSPRLQNAGLWVMLLVSGVAIGIVSQSPVDMAALAVDGWHALEKPTALTIITIAVNSVGTLVLVGGALWSAWVFWRKRMMRSRMIGLLLIAGGALTVAAGGSLTRFGHQQYLYIAMSIGIAIMFWGYLKTIQVDTRPVATAVLPTPQASVGD